MQCAWPCCYLLPVPLYNIFPHYHTKGTIFEKKLLNIKSVFWFSLQALSETFFVLRRSERDIIINVHKSSSKVTPMLVRLYWNLNSRKIFEKYSHIKFNENPFSVGIVGPCGKRDGWTDMTTLGVAFRNFSNSHIIEWHLSYMYTRAYIFLCAYIYKQERAGSVWLCQKRLHYGLNNTGNVVRDLTRARDFSLLPGF